MNYNNGNYQLSKLNNLSFNQKDLNIKNIKQNKQKNMQNETQRGRNTRQFGSDITNLQGFNGSINKINNEIEAKKKSLSRKDSTSTRKISKHQDIRTKKHHRGVLDISVDDSAKNLKMEISNNSFGGSSMILDEPIMTRNQITEKLFHNDPQLIIEYVESIIGTFFETELNPLNKTFYPYTNYMRIMQRDINDKMRVILFDWLIDVQVKWKLLPETLFLTFNLIDRFLGMKQTPRDELQCVGVAALLLACKYEEIYFPELIEFQEITDNAFSKQEILKKENDILGILAYDLTVPSPLRFFEAFNVYLKLEGKDKAAVLFLIEMCSFDYCMLKYKPSLITTGCLMLIVSHNKQLKEILFFISRYSNDDIAFFCKDLMVVYYKPDHGSKALTRKYSQTKYFEIAKIDIIAEIHDKHNNLSNMNINMISNQNYLRNSSGLN